MRWPHKAMIYDSASNLDIKLSELNDTLQAQVHAAARHLEKAKRNAMQHFLERRCKQQAESHTRSLLMY